VALKDESGADVGTITAQPNFLLGEH
jgi:hypothetical protein